MVVCFSCGSETKELLDRLVASGHYRDHSEAIIAAISNLHVIHTELGSADSVVLASRPAHKESASATSNQEREALPAEPKHATSDTRIALQKSTASRAPLSSLLGRHESAQRPSHLAPAPTIRLPHDKVIPLDRWIFGQFNRLLPVKITCRALANFATNGLERQPLEKLAVEIATEATQFGRYLAAVDKRRNLSRDDALAIAFPKGDFKSTQRFANQFVGSTNREGAMLGLPAALKLIGMHPDYPEAISLTEVGWRFGTLPNPLLDASVSGKIEKFSAEEISFLLDHIIAAVPAEAFAYQIILKEVLRRNVTPDALDGALKGLSPAKRLGAPFVSTQRSGAISRMADLDLIARSRTATRVSYLITERGREFLRHIEQAATASSSAAKHA